MNSFFGKTFFDFKSIVTTEKIADVKLKLMSRDPTCQISAVSWITENLNTGSDADRESLIDTLIRTDVVTYLCEKICCTHGQLFTSMLHILEKLSHNVNFYKTNIAKSAIDSVARVAFIIAKRMEKNEQTLAIVAFTIYVILNGASRADISLDQICDLNQMILLVQSLKPSRSSKHVLRLSAARILLFVMENVKLGKDPDLKSSLFLAFSDTLLSINAMVVRYKSSENVDILQSAVTIICSICAMASRFCVDNQDNFATEIKSVMIQIVIPQFRLIKYENESCKANVTNLVECFNKIMQLPNCDNQLANSLVENGYLKYFLQIMFPSIRKPMAFLISQIIIKLLGNDINPDNSLEFREYINKGLLELPSSVNNFSDVIMVLETKGAASDALLLLLYHHSHKTHEYDFVSLSSIILKVVSQSDVRLVPVLKATWFLFAVSSLKRSLTDSVCYYSVAAKHLALLLQSHDLRHCYTHDLAVLEHSFDCEDFPGDLKYEIVRLWLDFGGDFEPILERHSHLMTNCLLSTLEISSEKLVDLSLEIIDELKKNEKGWDEICDKVWKHLPRVLVACSLETAHNVKGFLKLAQAAKPRAICLEMCKEAVNTLRKVLGDEKFDDDLKILLLKNVYCLLKYSQTCKSPEATELCVNDAQLLKKLCDRGFSRENFQLSAYCVVLLALIVENQREFISLSSNDGAILKIEPLKMLVLLARSNYELSRAALQLFLILLRPKVGFKSSVTIGEFENLEAAETAIFSWYTMLHQVFFKTLLRDWHLVFSCLIAVLNFCKNRYPAILKGLCEYSGTYELVRWTIENEYKKTIFFQFADAWLHHGITHRSDNIAQANYSRHFEIRAISDEFDEVINMLSKYRD